MSGAQCCTRWDLSRHFLLRLALMIFTVVLIYSVAQLNVVSLNFPLIASFRLFSSFATSS